MNRTRLTRAALIVVLFGTVLVVAGPDGHTTASSRHPLVSPMGAVAPTEADLEGIPRVEFPPGSGQFYEHPVRIARIVHALFKRWDNGQGTAEELDAIDRFSAYLADTVQLRSYGSQEYAVWTLPIPLEEFGVESGWTSAFGNAAAALALEQAAVLFPENAARFDRIAALAVESLRVPIEHGGTGSQSPDGWCYEEVGAPAEPTCVLNGDVFALSYLYALGRGAEIDTSELWDEGIAHVRATLGLYDMPFASRYSPTGKYAEPDGYNALHVAQMLWLYKVTGIDAFVQAAAKWVQFDGSGNVAAISASGTIDPVGHGSEVLNDGAAWYGYWSASAASTIVAEVRGSQPTCGFNLFLVEGAEPATIAVHLDGRPVDPVLVAEAHSRSGAYATTVMAYAIPCRLVRELSLDLVSGGSGVVAVREIDLVGDGYALLREFEATFTDW